MDVVLSAAEAAETLRVSLPTFYAICRTPGFPAIRVGRKILVPTDGLNRWLAANEGRAVM